MYQYACYPNNYVSIHHNGIKYQYKISHVSRKYWYPPTPTPRGRFFGLHPPTPPEIPIWFYTFLLELLLFPSLSSMEFPLAVHGGGISSLLHHEVLYVWSRSDALQWKLILRVITMRKEINMLREKCLLTQIKQGKKDHTEASNKHPTALPYNKTVQTLHHKFSFDFPTLVYVYIHYSPRYRCSKLQYLPSLLLSSSFATFFTGDKQTVV